MKRFLITFTNRDDNLKLLLPLPEKVSYDEFRSIIEDNLEKKYSARNICIQKIEIYHPKLQTFEEVSESHLSIISNINYVHLLLTEMATSSNMTLQIEGRAFNFPNGIEINGMILPIQELSEGREQGTGLNTWDGAVVLAKYLETLQGRSLIENKLILEVGAGTGTTGLAALYLGGSLIALSDLDYTLQNLQSNTQRALEIFQISKNFSSRAVVMPLDWSNPSSYFYPSTLDPSYPSTWDVILGI